MSFDVVLFFLTGVTPGVILYLTKQLFSCLPQMPCHCNRKYCEVIMTWAINGVMSMAAMLFHGIAVSINKAKKCTFGDFR